jgi:hypothetical protein
MNPIDLAIQKLQGLIAPVPDNQNPSVRQVVNKKVVNDLGQPVQESITGNPEYDKFITTPTGNPGDNPLIALARFISGNAIPLDLMGGIASKIKPTEVINNPYQQLPDFIKGMANLKNPDYEWFNRQPQYKKLLDIAKQVTGKNIDVMNDSNQENVLNILSKLTNNIYKQ